MGKTILLGLDRDAVGAIDDPSVLTAPDVETALRLLAGAETAVVLVAGRTLGVVVDVCTRLRAGSVSGDAVVVASVRGDESDVRAVLAAGADDFFVESLGQGNLASRLLVAHRAAAARHARRSAEADRDAFFEVCLDLLCVAGFDGYFKRVNPAWTKELGWSAEELLSRPWCDFVHPDDVESTIAAGAKLRSGHAVVGFTNRYRTLGGEYRWLAWQCVPATDRQAIYGAVRDVTESRAASDELRAVSESLATTLHSIGDAVIAADVNARILRMNPAAEALTGWTLAEARGRGISEIFEIVNEDTRQPVEDPIKRSIRENRVVGLASRTMLRRRDGSEIPIADSCAPIRAVDLTVAGAVLVFRDLTRDRAAIDVQSRYQEQLVFADRMASVGTLAAGVAHEINNPLTYVAANVDMAIEEIRALSGGSPGGRMLELEEMLVEAREGASRITKIVRGLKTFSRLDEERRTVVDVLPVLELSINMAFNEIRHRARLVKDYGSLPLVEADDARLGQVFINLLVNAAQALPEAAGDTAANEIRVVTSTDAAGNAVVEVRDSGPGIPPSVLARIFDPFFTTKPVGVGTGLGLAICHNIITGMGGSIAVESKIGRGTTFRVVLPPSRATSAADRGAPLPDAPAAAGPAVKVLLVDDEPAVGIAVRRVLRGDDVTVLTSAQAALALLATGEEFDVVLSDLMMPGMSGMELYRALAERHPRMAMRVVFVTGGAFTPEANAFLSGVPNERLYKPFAFEALREMVRKFAKPRGTMDRASGEGR